MHLAVRARHFNKKLLPWPYCCANKVIIFENDWDRVFVPWPHMTHLTSAFELGKIVVTMHTHIPHITHVN